jgi:hypothetical protein
MRRFYFILILIVMAAAAPLATAGSAKIIKVLPEYLDKEGRNSVSPSLYDRDAYQAILRKNASLRSALCFYVQWKSWGTSLKATKLKVEMRGVFGNMLCDKTVEMPVSKRGWFGTWTKVVLDGEDYKHFGDLIAWRVTFWDGDQQLAEQRSFMW